jgi:Ca-activated chloride channel family protein
VLNFQFQYKEFLLIGSAVIIFILLFILLLRWKRRATQRIGDKKLVNLLTSDYSPGLFALKFILFTLAYASGVIAVANLRKPGAGDNITRKGIDVVFALDASKSMLATDIAPNRLGNAKQLILNMMSRMPNDRVALVLFGGQAYRQMPLSYDHDAAAMFVTTASPEDIPSQGTNLADAMSMSAKAFNSLEGRFKTIILISDGEDHSQVSMDTAQEIAKQGIMICTVGIGSPEGSPIPDSTTGEMKKDAGGNVIISRLNEEELKTIAQTTHGGYVHLVNIDIAANELLTQLSQIEKKTFSDVSLLNYNTYYAWFAMPMFLLLMIEFLLPETRRKKE